MKRYLRDVRPLVARALALGAKRETLTLVRWDIAGNCEKPYITSITGYAERDVKFPRGQGPKMELILETRCRQCDRCRRTRQNLWSHRLAAETALWPRTWMGTITCSPEAHFRFLTLARKRYSPNGDFDALDGPHRFRILEREYWREMSLMLKRIREDIRPGLLRHCAVTELHKSGLPHYHVLIHECDVNNPIKYTSLDGQWPHGFTKWRLVKSINGATYIGKYLSKAAEARVRASRDYGNSTSVDVNLFHMTPDQREIDPQIGRGGSAFLPDDIGDTLNG